MVKTASKTDHSPEKELETSALKALGKYSINCWKARLEETLATWVDNTAHLIDTYLKSFAYIHTGLYYDSQEMTPFLLGDFRYNKAKDKVTKFSSLEVEVRALIEGQFIAKRAHAEDFGFKIGLQ